MSAPAFAKSTTKASTGETIKCTSIGILTCGRIALQTKGRRAGLSTAIGHGLWTFIRTYIFKRGFLDGREGFILAVSNAEGTYYRYLKLMYLRAPQRLDP